MGCCASEESKSHAKSNIGNDVEMRSSKPKEPQKKVVFYQDGEEVPKLTSKRAKIKKNVQEFEDEVNDKASFKPAVFHEDDSPENDGDKNEKRESIKDALSKVKEEKVQSCKIKIAKRAEEKKAEEQMKEISLFVYKWKNRGGNVHKVYLRLFDNDVYYGEEQAKVKDNETLKFVKLRMNISKNTGKLRDKATNVTIIPKDRIISVESFREDGINIVSQHKAMSAKKTQTFGFLPVEKSDADVLQRLLEMLGQIP